MGRSSERFDDDSVHLSRIKVSSGVHTDDEPEAAKDSLAPDMSTHDRCRYLSVGDRKTGMIVVML